MRLSVCRMLQVASEYKWVVLIAIFMSVNRGIWWVWYKFSVLVTVIWPKKKQKKSLKNWNFVSFFQLMNGVRLNQLLLSAIERNGVKSLQKVKHTGRKMTLLHSISNILLKLVNIRYWLARPSKKTVSFCLHKRYVVCLQKKSLHCYLHFE